MADVNWDNVPKPDTGAQAPKKSAVPGTLAFILFLVVGLAAGGGYVNSVLLGNRVRDLAVGECPDSTCQVDVRAKHVDCYSANTTYAAPASLADFQTAPDSPKLGIGTVNLDAYRACVRPNKPRTLAEEAQ